jgi:hypothetical protein
VWDLSTRVSALVDLEFSCSELTLFFLATVLPCTCHAHIPLLKTDVLSGLFIPPITSCGYLCFRLVFQHHMRWKCSTLLPTCLICAPEKHSLLSVCIFHCLASILMSPILCVFGCKFYPNLLATTAHKLAPWPTVCIFLRYPSKHNRYRCLNLATNRIIIYHHVTFDESSFPFIEIFVLPSSHFNFLSNLDCAPLCIGPRSVTGIATPLSGQGASVPPHSTQQVVASNVGTSTHLDATPATLIGVAALANSAP